MYKLNDKQKGELDSKRKGQVDKKEYMNEQSIQILIQKRKERKKERRKNKSRGDAIEICSSYMRTPLSCFIYCFYIASSHTKCSRELFFSRYYTKKANNRVKREKEIKKAIRLSNNSIRT